MAQTTNTSTTDFDNAVAVLQQWLPHHVHALQTATAHLGRASLSRRAALIFSIAAQPVSTLEHAQALLDKVFRPLAKYATCEEPITELFNAIVVLVQSGSEETMKAHRAIFAARGALEEIYFPVVQRVNAVEPCQWCLKLLRELTSDPDCRAVFATADVRDRMLVPLAQYTTTEESTCGLFAVINSLVIDPKRRAVFGTAAVRDRIFLAKVNSVTTHRCVAVFLNALLLIMGGDGTHAALFKTQAVRDMVFLPLVDRLDSAITVRLFIACLQIIVRPENTGEKTALLYGTKAVRDRLFVPLVKRVTTDELAVLFFNALNVIVCSCARNSPWITSNTLRHRVILPLAKFYSSPQIAQRIVSILCFMIRDPPTLVPLHTSKMRDDVLIPLTRQMVANARIHPTEMEALSRVVASIVTYGAPANAHPSAVFATAAVRDEIIVPLAQVVTDGGVEHSRRLFRMIDACQCGSARRVFATPAVRDELFCRHAAPAASVDVDVVWNALAHLVDNEGRRALFATAAVRDDVLVPLFESVPIQQYCSFLRAFRDVPLVPDGASTEPRSFMNEVLLALADKCTTTKGAARLAMAINVV